MKRLPSVEVWSSDIEDHLGQVNGPVSIVNKDGVSFSYWPVSRLVVDNRRIK